MTRPLGYESENLLALMQNIAFRPETLEAQKERFNKVISKVTTIGQLLDQTMTVLSGVNNPDDREGVFDFDSGVRMIASREDYLGTDVIHLSFGTRDQKTGRPIEREKFIAETSKIMAFFLQRGDPLTSMTLGFAFHIFFRTK